MISLKRLLGSKGVKETPAIPLADELLDTSARGQTAIKDSRDMTKYLEELGKSDLEALGHAVNRDTLIRGAIAILNEVLIKGGVGDADSDALKNLLGGAVEGQSKKNCKLFVENFLFKFTRETMDLRDQPTMWGTAYRDLYVRGNKRYFSAAVDCIARDFGWPETEFRGLYNFVINHLNSVLKEDDTDEEMRLKLVPELRGKAPLNFEKGSQESLEALSETLIAGFKWVRDFEKTDLNRLDSNELSDLKKLPEEYLYSLEAWVLEASIDDFPRKFNLLGKSKYLDVEVLPKLREMFLNPPKEYVPGEGYIEIVDLPLARRLLKDGMGDPMHGETILALREALEGGSSTFNKEYGGDVEEINLDRVREILGGKL